MGEDAACDGLARPLRVVFLDVDQADATLVLTPSGRRLLVDAAGGRGPSPTVGPRVVAPALWAAGVRRLDYLVLTHGHPDHVGGAATVLSDFRPREVWEGVPVSSSAVLAGLRAVARTHDVAWRTVQTGDALSLGAVRVEVKHPPRPDWERPTVRNDDSVVLDIRYGDVSVVLPGDIGNEAERVVLDTITPAAIRVLKVPHHGSRTSSSPAFVDALASQVVVVSAGGANPFGHPAPEVVRRYEDDGATVLSTARHGAVTLCTDGREIRVETVADATVLRLRRP